MRISDMLQKSTMLVDYLRVICTADNIIYANLSDFADIFNTDNLNSVVSSQINPKQTKPTPSH